MGRKTCHDTESIPEELLACLSDASKVVVLTGAGVSAESGIPTFREAHTGLWARYDPMELASPAAFDRDPATVWAWYQWRRELIARARPNPGHHALAQLQHRVAELVTITQNVDGFHALAGSDDVLELHGNIQRNVCSRTGRPIDAAWLERHSEHQPPPSPHHQQGLARPDVVWFGEALDAGVIEKAFSAAESCDVVITAGTSGAVQPAASIPVAAVRAGAVMIDVNPEPNELSRLARWHLAGPSATWLPALVKALGGRPA
ncbi:SIR2 family NAD-dependent protein deacylase [Wenzhouxiangella sediminis]|uniref:NAD-dependent protein deacylase n=1 Tax=Wenzhouxiangella sediminis TaxID=1792836 RepID=A0A3E1KD02_9GAMM|nr:NAD-dependent deacylase [Wenzhouxiangella sediminis]RFF32729.1 NAD-dependent deacylase [Wenzhouxiangella sediminis]